MTLVGQTNQGVVWQTGLAHGIMDSLNTSIWDNPAWKRPRGTPIELMAAASQCLLLGVTQYGKGACMGTRKA